jgi:hypothetical protein
MRAWRFWLRFRWWLLTCVITPLACLYAVRLVIVLVYAACEKIGYIARST